MLECGALDKLYRISSKNNRYEIISRDGYVYWLLGAKEVVYLPYIEIGKCSAIEFLMVRSWPKAASENDEIKQLKGPLCTLKRSPS